MDNQTIFQTVFQNATIGVIVVDSSGQILRANPFVSKLFGYEPKELTGQNVEVLIPESYRKIHRSHQKEFIQKPHSRPMGTGLDLFGRRKDGTEFPVDISLGYNFVNGGQLVSAFITDITETKRVGAYNRDISRILEESLNEVYIFDAISLKFIQVNKGGRKNLGYSLDELKQMTPLDIEPEYTNATFLQLILPLLNGEEEKIIFETVHLRKDRTTYPVQVHLQYATLGNQAVFFAIILDISKQIENEQKILEYSTHLEQKVRTRTHKLTEKEGKLEEAQQVAKIGFWEWDLGTDEVYWSDQLFHNFGLEPRGLTSISEIFEYVHPEDIELMKSEVARARKSGELQTVNFRIITPEGKIRYMYGVNIRQIKEGEQVIKMTGIVQDVTIIKQAELALKENEDKLKAAQKIAKLGYWDWDYEKKSLQCSEEIFQIFGFKKKRPFTPKTLLMHVHPDDFSMMKKWMKTAWIEGIGNSIDFRIIDHTGTEKYLSSFVNNAHYDAAGKVVRLFGIAQDITFRKKAELQLESALKNERELNELKSRFVAMASHEFRTPLTSILSSVGLIEAYNQRDQPEKINKHIKRIKTSVNNLTSILNEFLSLEKLETGKVQFNPVYVEIGEFINDILEEIQLIAKENQFILHTHTGNLKVYIDRYLVKNILINLLSNAIKYSQSGKNIELITEMTEGQLIFLVKDKGMGIPEEDQKQMFSRFFRATNVYNIKGTGLGLTIVKHYLDLMGGRISFVSKLNVGTTFKVVIPQENQLLN